MAGYDGYINKIRSVRGEADYERLFGSIELKLIKQKQIRQRSQVRRFLAGTLAVLIMGFSLYYIYPALQAQGSEQLFSYVFGPPEVADGPVIDYVFSN